MLGLVENIAPHFSGGTISDADFPFFNLVLDKIVPSLDMLGSL